MKDLHRYNLPLVCVGILLVVIIAGAQQPDKSVARLKLEHNRLVSVMDDPTTTQEIRELNKQLLAKNEALMRDAILRSIADLETYAQHNADILDNDDRRDINERIEAYRYDLAQMKGNGKQLPAGKQPFDSASAANGAMTDGPLLKSVIDDGTLPSSNIFLNTSNTGFQGLPAAKSSSPPHAGTSSSRSLVPAPKSYVRPGSAATTKHTLTVNINEENGGRGTVSDQTGGLDCSSGCAKDFDDGTAVVLSVQSTTDSTFAGWTGDCTGMTCTVAMNGDKTVTAKFSKPAVASGSNPEPYDWGRVHAYFTSGVILSKDRDITSTERNNFSKPDIYLDFTIDNNWLPNKKGRFLGIFNNANTFFSARLTSVPVTNVTPVTTPTPSLRMFGPSPPPTPQCASAECATFLTSEKAARLEAGAYFPIEIGQWNFAGDHHDHALFIAPLFKGGIQTITGDRASSTAEARRFGGDDIYNFFSIGSMFGHYKKSGDTNIAPELINWLTISAGRFENFEYLDTDGPKDSNGNYLIRRRPWRYEATGMLKVPKTAFVIGFNGNFGKGPDDLRFLFGLRFDVAKVLDKLGTKP